MQKISETYPGKLGVQQRVLPVYRAPFFELLAPACSLGLGVFAGVPGSKEGIVPADSLETARLFPARNLTTARAASPFYLGWQAGLLTWLNTWQPDVLVVETNPRTLSTFQAIRWMHARRRPVIGWGLGAPPAEGISRFISRSLRDRLIHGCDGLIAYSQQGAEQYAGLGFPAERIAVAPNAVAPAPDQAPTKQPEPLRERTTVLFVGRLQARKRVDALLAACADLPEELQPRLWIVGEGPVRSELESFAEAVYPRAEFFGARHGEDLAAIFASADLFVLPGTGGLAVQEAMAAGLPVIVAEGDGTQNDLVSPRNGWLIPPEDEAALANALREALTDRSRLRQMGAESYRIVADEINLESMVGAFIRTVKRIETLGLKESGSRDKEWDDVQTH